MKPILLFCFKGRLGQDAEGVFKKDPQEENITEEGGTMLVCVIKTSSQGGFEWEELGAAGVKCVRGQVR